MCSNDSLLIFYHYVETSSLTMCHSFGLSRLLFEYTLCQTQIKLNVITLEIKKAELRPDKTWVIFMTVHIMSGQTQTSFEAVARRPKMRYTTCPLMRCTVCSVCENAIKEFVTLCNLLKKYHPLTEPHFGLEASFCEAVVLSRQRNGCSLRTRSLLWLLKCGKLSKNSSGSSQLSLWDALLTTTLWLCCRRSIWTHC